MAAEDAYGVLRNISAIGSQSVWKVHVQERLLFRQWIGLWILMRSKHPRRSMHVYVIQFMWNAYGI